MSLQLVHSDGGPTQPVRIHLPLPLWEKLRDLTPPDCSVQSTIVKAVTDFVEQEAINTAGKV